MTALRLIAFDLDDTLAPSKTPLPPQIANLLLRLLDRVEVCIISGGHFAQFESQVIARLETASAHTLQRLHLMPTCGTQYYLHQDGSWTQQYAENLSIDEKDRALGAARMSAEELGYWEAETWGPILEDRGSQITFSALGQGAPVDAKKAWDPSGIKKDALRTAVAAQLPDLEVRSGGSTSIDITRKGIDKAYGMRKLSALTEIPLSEMLFVGDRLDESGNDYPVKALGVRCEAVGGWEETIAVVEALLVSIPAGVEDESISVE